MKVVKAHAFGNDFLLVDESEIVDGVDRAALARQLCERHRGLGADGLIVSAVAFLKSSLRCLAFVFVALAALLAIFICTLEKPMKPNPPASAGGSA